MVEAVMRDRDYNINMLLNLYKDNPSNLYKATVVHKNKFVCNWDETKLTEPKRLQDIIEVFSNDIQDARAFIRPSGTEDVLRIYVEAKLADDVQRLADIILEEIETRYRDHGSSNQGACGFLCGTGK